MTLEAVRIKNHIVDYLIGITASGDTLAGLNVYESANMPFRTFYPCVTVDTPRITLQRRLVGGSRIFQLNISLVLYITERDSISISGTEYKRDDLNKIYADRIERALEEMGLPSGVTIYGVPETGSIQLPSMDGNYKYYQSSIDFMLSYIESD